MIRFTMLAIAALGVACGKDAAPSGADHGGPPTAGGNAKKPCAYLARADAEAALELALPGTTETEVTGECNYHSAEFYGVTFAIGTWDGVLLSANSGGQNHPPKPVAGIGDEAVSLGEHLYVRKGQRGLMVSLNGPAVDADHAKALARARDLAMKILPKM
ncbi:MAG TPA: hypothetical protein VFQ65_04135 [Kofleriaceae bacterium]|nr:hypothetical protein [Kofleriaceae bacterium]